MRSTRPLPPSFRRFSHPGYENVYALPGLRDERKLYCTETIPGLNDWDAPTLLMAQDAAPVDVIKDRIRRGESNPWRHGVRGDSMGWPTNERVQDLANRIRGSKLYGSVLAHMLKIGEELPELRGGLLHDHLQRVLEFVVGDMTNLQALVCLGNIPHQLVASWADDVRTAAKLPVGGCEEVGLLGRRVLLCRLYHPSRAFKGGWKERRAEWHDVAGQINQRIA